MKKLVYIAHPIGGDVENNLKDLVRILRVINTNSHDLKDVFVDDTKYELLFDFSEVIPLAPYYADILALDDNNSLERKRGIENDIEIIQRGLFDELWLTGDNISFGMSEEIKLFKLLGTPIVNYIGKI